ncbi:MATE family efflux transporter [Anaeromicropila populeti]|uniref:Probable multidrug resistance protein NorM n=1 Tax=Anaeromicropila populeti TaxID=37658 RepID=A0A1I6J3R7_9FIRM|nr:MATE family efflux transporter [Anaeromicropila populeti]SFR73120.1 putative efflux protein, MATE family [Anaeromicropila populeti]
MRNMTSGNISKHLIRYSVPLILGNLFQLTYNAVDSIIISRFASKESLAAVGTANPIMNIIIFFIIGICMGASVLMSEFFGSDDTDTLTKEISTTLIFGLISTTIISIICILLSRPVLLLMNTPDEILEKSALYLKIIFLGLLFTFLYNVFASALRSIGDAKTPLYFLSLASVLNGCLDFLFIAFFQLDIVGAALATIIAEAISAILCIFYIYKKVPVLHLSRKALKIDVDLLKKTLHYGWATAMQQTCLYIGKLLVQGAVNPLGVDAIAAFNAVNRVDDFAFTPEQSISHSVTTFVAQNRGAKTEDRIMKGFKIGLVLEIFYWVFICILTFLCAELIMKLFAKSHETEMINLGKKYLQLMAFFYLLPAVTNLLQGFFRGIGNMKITLVCTTVQMIFRVTFVYLFAPSFGIPGIAYACLLGWIAMLSVEVPYFFHSIKNT